MSLKLSKKWELEGFLESAREHTGKLIDQGNLFDFIVQLGVAYFGARAAQKSFVDEKAPPEALLGGITLGLVGFRLATTMGGTPPVSQMAGLAILTGIGAIDVGALDWIENVIGFAGKSIDEAKKELDRKAQTAKEKCTEMGGKHVGSILPPFGLAIICELPSGERKVIPA